MIEHISHALWVKEHDKYIILKSDTIYDKIQVCKTWR